MCKKMCKKMTKNEIRENDKKSIEDSKFIKV